MSIVATISVLVALLLEPGAVATEFAVAVYISSRVVACLFPLLGGGRDGLLDDRCGFDADVGRGGESERNAGKELPADHDSRTKLVGKS